MYLFFSQIWCILVCRWLIYVFLQSNYFRKGLLPLLLLQQLQQKDMYGYELVKAIAARTNGMITVKEGAMYPVLYQVLEAGQVSERRVPHKKG